jgi:hypothetical protein
MPIKNPNKKFQNVDLLNIKNHLNEDNDLARMFIDDVIRITGFEIDDEGYVVDAEDDPIEPDYIQIRGKVLRHSDKGILHLKDLIFDPYNNPMIMEELFKRYLSFNHPEVISHQIYPYSPNAEPKINTYGYIVVLYNNGNKIKTHNHYKDSTKYLEAWMMMESYFGNIIEETLRPYDEYEDAYFKELARQAIVDAQKKK